MKIAGWRAERTFQMNEEELKIKLSFFILVLIYHTALYLV